jgi:hypothetical protein
MHNYVGTYIACKSCTITITIWYKGVEERESWGNWEWCLLYDHHHPTKLQLLGDIHTTQMKAKEKTPAAKKHLKNTKPFSP